MNPLYKWVGSKRTYVDTIKGLMPSAYNTYHEPFFGGGSLYFDLEPRLALISDANKHSINFIKALAAAPNDLIDQLSVTIGHYNSVSKPERRRLFEAARAGYNQRNAQGWTLIHLELAAAFYGLVRGAFNGMWRVNAKGEFNNPFGDGKPLLFDADHFRSASKLLARTTIRNVDFGVAIGDAGEGDFVFVDPPYFETWNGYVAGGTFGVPEHYRLRRVCGEAVKRGAKVMVAVGDHPYLRSLYKGWRLVEMERNQQMSGKAEGRKRERDIVLMGGYDD